MEFFKRELLGLAAVFLIFGSSAVFASDQVQEYVITIKGHKFIPAEFEVPAGQRVKVVVENQDATAEEFESYDLRREKVVAGNGRITVFIGPLKPGQYKFFGEFHPATAQGVIIVK